jgi:magnesium transporter
VPVVKLACLALEPAGGMRPETEAAALAAWRGGAGPYWVDLEGGRPDAVASWLAGIGVSPGTLELLQLGEDETRIVPLVDSVYLAYPMSTGDKFRKPAHFRIFCLDRLAITMHDEPAASSLIGVDPARIKLQEGSTAGVVCALTVVHSARFRREVLELRAEGDALADRMDSDPGAVSLQEILALKRRVLALGVLVDEELAILEVLKLINTPVLPLGRLAGPFQIAIETTRATDRDIDRLDRRAADLQSRYESVQQDKTNRRLGVLTILSAIFMPLTLITGIYGMNFEVMPELHHRYGYPIALGLMASIAGGLYGLFRWRGWLK